MSRKFDIGRQNEVLMNATHYDIYKMMEYYFEHPDDFNRGPIARDSSSEIMNGALWLDKYNSNNADLKYYENGIWKLLFEDRFKLIMHMLESTEPQKPIEGQLWINKSGVLNYYHNGQFQPIKSTLSDTEDTSKIVNDFLIISPLKSAEHAVLNNFSKFLFANTPIQEWKKGVKYAYQQGVIYNNVLYICNKVHYSSDTITIENPYYWSRLDSLAQFLVPNTVTDKIFIDGIFLPEKIGDVIEEIKDTLFKTFGMTFEYEENEVIHDSFRIDVENDKGFYDEITLVTPENEGTEVETPSDTVEIKPTINEDEGYIKNTNISLYIPMNQIEEKLVTAIHVDPKKINKITKYFVKIDKSNKTIAIPKENTEFYAIKNGIGKLLIESTDDMIYDYCSFPMKGNICIKLSDVVADEFDYVYALHYEFASNVKKIGKLYRKKIKLNDKYSIYIGKTNPRKLCVFAQGLFYQQDNNTYEYNYEDEYIYMKESLIDNITNERFEISVLSFPNLYRAKLSSKKYNENNYIKDKGYRFDLNAIPYGQEHCLGFLSGIQVNPKEDFVFYKDDPTAVYFPNFTKEYINSHGGEIEWIIVETDKIENGTVIHEMYRGKTIAKKIENKIGISITRDKNLASEELLFLDHLETPIIFVDGILISQKDIEIQENYLSIANLSEGQDIILLADTNKNITLDDIIEKTDILINLKSYDPVDALEENDTKSKIIEEIKDIDSNVDILTSYIYEDLRYVHSIYNFNKLLEITSDSILFQDNAANITIQTETNDSSIVYLKEGLICDTDSVNVLSEPLDGYHGEIRHVFNAVQDKWIIYNSNTQLWEDINKTEISDIKNNVNGYYSTNKNISLLLQKEGKYLTYFSYVYSDTVEKKLLTGYCIPDGHSGINNDINSFVMDLRHHYTPGRNELTVYLNGIRQNLDSPFDNGYESSLSKECSINGSNTFTLAINDGTKTGKAINEYDGYYTYKLDKLNKYKYIYKTQKLSENEINKLKTEGYTVNLVSSPNKNSIFYVIEPCESNELISCDRNVLTFKDSLSSKGAFANNTYQSDKVNLSKGHVKVFINGLRQPYGSYNTLDGETKQSYKIINSNTIQILDDLIGGTGANIGTLENPKFEINKLNGNSYFKVLDEIVIETRNDYNLREITIPFEPGKTEFTVKDGLPEDLFKTKDIIMIYINGLAYGNDYKNEYNTIKLKDNNFKKITSNSNNNVITFEWR